jgi:hypothetical protein
VLDRLNDNDASPTAELLHGSVVQRRNRIALDWDSAWRLDTGGSDRFDREVIDVSVHFAARICAGLAGKASMDVSGSSTSRPRAVRTRGAFLPAEVAGVLDEVGSAAGDAVDQEVGVVRRDHRVVLSRDAAHGVVIPRRSSASCGSWWGYCWTNFSVSANLPSWYDAT